MKLKGSINQFVALTLLTFVVSGAIIVPGHAAGVEPACSFPKKAPARLTEADRSTVHSTLEKSPLLFVENRGQVDSQVAYYIQGSDNTIYFTAHGVTFALSDKDETRQVTERLARRDSGKALKRAAKRWAVNLSFIGTDRDVQPKGENPTATTISYFRGPKDQWKTGLQSYSTLVYPNLWPGIDLLYTGTSNRLKYEFIVKPGADPEQIKLAYSGATGVRLNPSGQLNVVTPFGSFQDNRPISYQEVDGKPTEVATSFNLQADRGQNPKSPARKRQAMKIQNRVVYGFRVGSYDRRKPLVIDPAIVIYAGYIGGVNSETSLRVAVDGAGNAYIAGQTTSDTSEGFQATVGPDNTFNPDRQAGSASFHMVDVFVAKVKADGTGLAYAGYIGGVGNQVATGIAVDSAGNAYVVGATDSYPDNSFPATVGPKLQYSGAPASNAVGIFDWFLADGFIAKVNASGTGLAYCGYIGGDNFDFAYSVAVDQAGSAYVTGETTSSPASLPATVGPSLSYSGGGFDAFVAKVKADGTGFDYLGYIGGNKRDRGFAIAVDSQGSAYVTGDTTSPASSLPVKVGPSLTFGNSTDAFVAKVKPDGSGLVYLGYIGGAKVDMGSGIAVDSAGNAYVAGGTRSPESSFPVKIGPKLTYNGSDNNLSGDAFVAKVKADGTGLVYAGYIGGTGGDTGFDIKLDAAGNAYVVGATTSANFPANDGSIFKGGTTYGDAFVAVVRADGSGLLAGGYFGGANDDVGTGIALDGEGNIYITGTTLSSEATFPATAGPFLAYKGSQDAFVAKLKFTINANAPTVSSVSPNSGPMGGGTSVTITGTKFANGAAVSFGGSAATNVVVASDTRITATTPAHDAGAVNVVVTNPSGESGVLAQGFTYIAQPVPVITSVTRQGKHLLVVGQNFDSGAVILLNGERRKTLHDDQDPNTLLGKKLGKVAQPGDKVKVQNSDGTQSNEVIYALTQ
ncbi:MAG TPA: SBBP repeat-containing protein [Blastocatellia bacterium]|nr:SBBP repeat-containing protein [Blastocatellia bacterium]